MFFNYDLLELVRREPPRLLGTRSAHCLAAFIAGHSICPGGSFDVIWFPIQDRLKEKYRYPDHLSFTLSYADMLFVVSEDDAASLDLFYRELDEYMAANPAARDGALWPAKWPWPSGLVAPNYSPAEMLKSVEKRPAMYLGRPSLIQLRAFLGGEEAALNKIGFENTTEARIAAFEAWLNEREGFGTRRQWHRILLALSGGRDERAFDMFFELLTRFEGQTIAN